MEYVVGQRVAPGLVVASEQMCMMMIQTEAERDRYKAALKSILRTAPLVIVPNNPTYNATTCSCCRSKDADARRALGLTV